MAEPFPFQGRYTLKGRIPPPAQGGSTLAGKWGSEAQPGSHTRAQQTLGVGNPPPHFKAMNDYLIVQKDKTGTDHLLVEMVSNMLTLPPKSNLVMQYKQQFALHGFCTINKLMDTEYFTPKVLGELLELALPFATCLCIMKHAKVEVQCTQEAFLSGDHLVLI